MQAVRAGTQPSEVDAHSDHTLSCSLSGDLGPTVHFRGKLTRSEEETDSRQSLNRSPFFVFNQPDSFLLEHTRAPRLDSTVTWLTLPSPTGASRLLDGGRTEGRYYLSGGQSEQPPLPGPPVTSTGPPRGHTWFCGGGSKWP